MVSLVSGGGESVQSTASMSMRAEVEADVEAGT